MRLLSTLVLLSVLGTPAIAEPTINTDKLMFHVKESFNIPPGVDMKLGSPEKSDMPGLWKVVMTLSKGGQTQDRTLLVSEDGAHYLAAEIQDVNKLPDTDNLKGLNLQGAPAKGPAAAKVSIVEYTDFQCPYCKRAHEVIEENLFKTYGDKVRLVFKHYPLTSIHPWAETGSVAAACVAKVKPEAFWKVANGMFAIQSDLNLDNLKAKVGKIAADAGVDKKKFEACQDSKETLDTVKKDTAEGDALGVNSTPTLFVNGHRMTGFGGFDQLKALVDEMLAGTHAPASLKN